MHSAVSTALSQCDKLNALRIRVPYHAPAFSQAIDLLAKLEHKSLPYIHLYLDQYPGCSEPSAADWERLDGVFQQAKYAEDSATQFSLVRQSRNVTGEVVWGDRYAYAPFDGEYFGAELQRFLPETRRRRSPYVEYAVSVDADGYLDWRKFE